MKKIIAVLIAATLLMATQCNEPQPTPEPEPEPEVTDFAKGADVSWLTQMEHDGCKFYTPT